MNTILPVTADIIILKLNPSEFTYILTFNLLQPNKQSHVVIPLSVEKSNNPFVKEIKDMLYHTSTITYISIITFVGAVADLGGGWGGCILPFRLVGGKSKCVYLKMRLLFK